MIDIARRDVEYASKKGEITEKPDITANDVTVF